MHCRYMISPSKEDSEHRRGDSWSEETMEEIPVHSDAISNHTALSSSVVTPVGANQNKNSNQAVTVSTAGIRAIVYQLQALYLRTPLKLFRPSRFDYLAYVREMANKHDKIDTKPYRISTHSSLGMLINVLKKEGWRFIPDQIMPPLIANSATGLILYGTYLNAVDASRRPAYSETWRAGFIAGAAQSLAAAPVDAIYTRSSAAEMINGKHSNLWMYGLQKLKEIGLVGVFAGYGFSLIKESLGFAFYFSSFELVKTKGYNLSYKLISGYRNLKATLREKLNRVMRIEPVDQKLIKLEELRSTKLLNTTFVLIAGASAAFSLLAVQYPLSKIQKIHLSRLEALDIYNSSNYANRPFIKLYYNSYIDTYTQILNMKRKSKMSWFQVSYKGFHKNALSALPATSVGLLVFEIMRTKLSDGLDGPDVLGPV